MPMLLEDLADETCASSRRAADRLSAEVANLDELERQATQLQQQIDAIERERGETTRALNSLEELRQRCIESARQATDFALSQVPGMEAVWRSAQAKLLKQPTGDDAVRLLETSASMFESCLRILRAARSLWSLPEPLKVTPERLDELERAIHQFERLASDAKVALEHRAGNWQPADPDRFAQGLQLAREDKTVKAAEARGWFRKVTS